MPGDKIFVDTNILVYAYDVSAGEKHKIAHKTVADLWNSGSGVLSTQVLQELFVTITQKIPKPVDIDLAKEIVSDLLKWNIVVNDGESILGAIEIHKKYKYSFWDSMIIESALKGRCSILLSEDLAEVQVGSVIIQNPFKRL